VASQGYYTVGNWEIRFGREPGVVGTMVGGGVTDSKGTSSTWNDKLVYVDSINEWTHIVVVYDGTITRLFINGVLVRSTKSASGKMKQTSNPLYIGYATN